MPRPLLAVLLGAAIVATLFLLLSGGGERDDRRERGATAPRDETETRTAVPPPRAREPEQRVPAGGRSWRLTGRVREEGGGGIPGATVRATAARTVLEVTTGGEGAYELALPDRVCAVDVWAPGYLPLEGTANGRTNGRHEIHLDGDGPWTRDFVLTPAAVLRGYAREGSGAPVAGARVYVLSPEHQVVDRETVGSVVVSDGKGAFEFPGLPAGVYDLGARAPGYRPALVRDVAMPGGGTVSRDVVLEPGRRIDVTVVNEPPDGGVDVLGADSRLRGLLLPPGGVLVLTDALVGRPFAEYPVTQGRRVAAGRYVLEGLGPGPADVWAEAKYVEDLYPPEPGLSRLFDTTEPELTLTLVRGVLATVHVRDAVTGKTIAPRVTRHTVGGPVALPVERLGEGDYVLPLDDRQHSLHFSLEGYQDAQLDLPRLEEGAGQPPVHPHPFDVAMVPVAEGETGAFYLVFEPPLEGRVALVGRDALGEQRFVRHLDRPDAKGRWEAAGVPVGEYAVSVLATGMVPVVLPQLSVSRTFKDTHLVRLTRGGGLAFKVTDQAGALLDQVHLLLRDAAGNRIDVHILTHVSEGRAFLSVNYLPSAASAKADSGLAPGAYTLAAGREGFEPATREFVIRDTEVADVELTLRPR